MVLAIERKEPRHCKSIEEIRAQIDLIDKQLVELFALRFEYVQEVVKYKENNKEAIVAEDRRQQVIEQRSEWARELGLDKDFYARLFESLIGHNISKELEIINQNIQ